MDLLFMLAGGKQLWLYLCIFVNLGTFFLEFWDTTTQLQVIKDDKHELT